MEEEGWKKDETPYLVFPCWKCKQYMYVKTSQKIKKCLRCGRQHTVSSNINSGEIVKGMTKAVEMVKIQQNEFAIKELGDVPEFRTVDDFIVKSRIKTSQEEISKTKTTVDNNYFVYKFREMLSEISKSYRKFPFYILEIMADNYSIPSSELRILVNNSLKEGYLIRSGDNLFTIH